MLWQVAIRSRLGASYRRAGDKDAARTHLAAAVDCCDTPQLSGHPLLYQVLGELAGVMADGGELTMAVCMHACMRGACMVRAWCVHGACMVRACMCMQLAGMMADGGELTMAVKGPSG